jgi:Fe-S-cluster containining protein
METPAALPDDPATDLCAACGLCCDGTLFYSVVLQPGDSAKELIGLGLKLQKKKKQVQFLQPCSAFSGTHCSIYEHRPTRCRAFECEQLRRMNGGEVSPQEAHARVAEARAHLEEVRGLLREMGEAHEKRNILRRYDAICARVPDASEEPKASLLKERLTASLHALEEFLTRHFRPPSPVASPSVDFSSN